MVLDLLGEGELFGQFSLLIQVSPVATIRAFEDTLAYLLPRPVAVDVLSSSAGTSLVLATMRRRLTVANDSVNVSRAEDRRFAPIGSLIRREPVTIDPDAPIAAAAARMAEQRVSSLLIPTPEGLAILDRPGPAFEGRRGESLLRCAGDRVGHDAGTDASGIDARRRRAARDVRARGAPLPRDRRRPRGRGRDRHGPDGDRPAHAVRDQERDRTGGDPGGRDRGRARTPQRRDRARRLERRSGLRRRRDRARDRRPDRTVRAARRPVERATRRRLSRGCRSGARPGTSRRSERTRITRWPTSSHRGSRTPTSTRGSQISRSS